MTALTLWIERVRNRFWILPAAGVVLAVVAGVLLPRVDEIVALPSALAPTENPDTARSTLQLIATLAVSVAGISFSVIVVALVLASQQFSPRVLRNFQRHPLNQTVLGVFLGTAAFSLFAQSAVEDAGGPRVPELSVAVAMVLAAASLVLFVFFLHHMVRSLNASAIIRRIAADGHQAVHAPYPAGIGNEPDDPQGAERWARKVTASCDGVAARAPRAGYVASVKAQDAIDAAEQADGFVEQKAAIGEFVVTGSVLAEVWCGGDAAALAERVGDAFVLNEERVVDDDVAFPLRQLADVALKGLSPGINDPTTAENAMDSVTDTLVRVAQEPSAARLRADSSGTPRLGTCAFDLDELVRLAFDQVRRDGARRPSFAVRLLELLADLRANGGPGAAGCREIDRQAKLLCEQSAQLAEVPADADLISETYQRLHDGAPARPMAAPGPRGHASASP